MAKLSMLLYGAALASALLLAHFDLRTVFAWAAVPAVLSVALNMPVPLVNVLSAGSAAMLSLLVK